MIRSIAAHNFRGIDDVGITFGRVTVLQGAMGAGKTSVADAILWTLLGEAGRGDLTADVIRQGQEEPAAVTLLLDDGSNFGRRRSRTKTNFIVDGTPVSEAEFNLAVAQKVGDRRSIRAALRSGAILEMDTGELQKYLVDLTRAKFDESTVLDALGAEVRAAAASVGVTLPKTLASFVTCEALAREKRIELKRVEAIEEAALKILGAPKLDVGERKVASIEKAIEKLTEKRQRLVVAAAASKAGDAAARAERMRGLEAQIADLRASLGEEVAFDEDGQKHEAELHAARRRAAEREAEAETARRALEDARREPLQPNDDAVAQAIGERKAKMDELTDELDDARTDRARLEREYVAARDAVTTLDGAAGGVCLNACAHCSVANAAAQRTKLKETFNALRADGDEAGRKAKELERLLGDANIGHAEALAAKRRVGAARQAIEHDARHTKATADARAWRVKEQETLVRYNAAVEATRARLERARKAARIADLERDAAKLAEPTEPAPVATDADVAAVDAGLARERADLDSARVRDAIAVAKAKLEATSAAVKAADVIAKALGPGGAKQALIARGVMPFLAAANAAFNSLEDGWSVSVDAEAFALRVHHGGRVHTPLQLSDGEREWCRWVLQIACAKLSKVPFVVLDRAELVDAETRARVWPLVEDCIGDGLQVLMLRHGDAGAEVDEDTKVYTIADGRIVGAEEA